MGRELLDCHSLACQGSIWKWLKEGIFTQSIYQHNFFKICFHSRGESCFLEMSLSHPAKEQNHRPCKAWTISFQREHVAMSLVSMPFPYSQTPLCCIPHTSTYSSLSLQDWKWNVLSWCHDQHSGRLFLQGTLSVLQTSLLGPNTN